MANALVYLSILLMIGMVASTGYQPASPNVNNNLIAGSVGTSTESLSPSVDQLAIASLAAATAEVANLSVSNTVSSASITLNVKSELAQQDESVIAKPLAFEPVSSSAIVTYRIKAGDSVPSVASQYGVTAQTIKWANNMTTDLLVADTDLLVPTVDGVVVVAKDGDTVEGLASKYKSDAARIISKNDLELTGIKVGQRIVLPGGVLPESERPGYVVPRTVTTTTTYARSNPLYTAQAGNRYGYGYCTWHAYNRRAQIGRPIGSFWGDATSWAGSAGMAGYTVTRGNPEVGDVMHEYGTRWNPAGHVAVVESKDANGDITVSEMNWGGNWNRITYRKVDAGATLGYNFIK